ncbi:thiamine biosynthesis protein ThiF [Bacillus toyonensis]|uniref:E2/UBC family protein n=1 Tax=Bacillus toyonensis TaxID=155322 RepID=UPI000BF33BEA|nr:E2/UBC family protein [Bacillus toyonensis]PGB81751.1 thiamine biosynthesis protein ThiF [Bacillus toyonensis]
MLPIQKYNFYNLDELITDIKKISVDEVASKRGLFKEAFEGTLAIEGYIVPIQVVLPKHFPLKKPMFILKEPQALGFIPHVEPDGFICYSHDEGLLLDQSNPSGILFEAYHRAVDTLRDGITKKNHADFQKEFESFWSRQKKKIKIDSLFSPGETFKHISVYIDDKTGKTIMLDQLDSETKQYINTLYKCDVIENFRHYHGVYIPLRVGAAIAPPPYTEFWNIKQIRKIIFNNISTSNKRQLNSYLKRRTFNRSEKEFILFSFPLQEGQRILFGISLSNFTNIPNSKARYPFLHPLKKNEVACDIIPLSIKRHDRNYLLNRTQGNNKLSEKKVTIIGLGSLGSRIAFELARAGVKTFTLIDEDILDVDNIFRHELGVQDLYWLDKNKYLNIPKAMAMAFEMRSRFPALNIIYEIANVLDLMEEKLDLIINTDLIIVALGSPTVELYLNQQFHQMKKVPPVIYTWLDPLGIGGHALLTNNNGEKYGCLQCLFTHPGESSHLISNKASFVAPGQFLGKTLAGCESVFTPYGSMDALQTAIIATRVAVKTLNSEVRDNPLLSWKGENYEMINKGYLVSKRYDLTSEQLFESRHLYKSENCPICGKDKNNDL